MLFRLTSVAWSGTDWLSKHKSWYDANTNQNGDNEVSANGMVDFIVLISRMDHFCLKKLPLNCPRDESFTPYYLTACDCSITPFHLIRDVCICNCLSFSQTCVHFQRFYDCLISAGGGKKDKHLPTLCNPMQQHCSKYWLMMFTIHNTLLQFSHLLNVFQSVTGTSVSPCQCSSLFVIMLVQISLCTIYLCL